MTDATRHWNHVWTAKAFEETSWYQPDPAPSLRWIDLAVADGGSIATVIDAGCGVSHLADRLLDRGAHVVGVDIAATAIERLRGRLADRPDDAVTRFTGIVGDLGEPDPLSEVSSPATIWHDRAVLHFLHGEARERYAETVRRHLAPGGHAIIAGFAPGGPSKCSGLDVVQSSADDIVALLGDEFHVLAYAIEVHRTPWDAEQAFQWTLLRRRQ